MVQAASLEARQILSSGYPAVIQLPTGSGKTHLAFQEMLRKASSGRRSIYVVPLRAVAEELFQRWQDQTSVGLFTGDSGNPVPFEEARILIMTPEKLDSLTRTWRNHWHWLPEVDLVVVDEFHLLGEVRRGAKLEGTLLRLLRLNPFIQVVGLSATLGNRGELASWLGAVEVTSDHRPVPLEWYILRYKKAEEKLSMLISYLGEQEGQSLIFVQSRRRAEQVASGLAQQGFRVMHHHAGLNRVQRQKVEQQFRSGELEVLVATATLEMGINLPARRVILYDLQRFDGNRFTPLPANNLWQRAGRAGRPGLDDKGEVVLLAAQWESNLQPYTEGRFEPIQSQLNNPVALAEQILVEVATGLSQTQTQLEANLSLSLAAFQKRLPSLRQAVDEMVEAGMLYQETTSPRLRSTPLGWIAVRHMLSPKAVSHLQEGVGSMLEPTLFDFLLLVVSNPDVEPVLPVDFEDLSMLAEYLRTQTSRYMSGEIGNTLGISGKRLLSTFLMACVLREWTQRGELEQASNLFGIYSFELERLLESSLRILAALIDWLGGFEEQNDLREKAKALHGMLASGLSEEAISLTLVRGLGSKWAKKLLTYGFTDIEDLALAETHNLTQIKGISSHRAEQWIAVAFELAKQSRRYLDEGPETQVAIQGPTIDLYRLRRSLELHVLKQETGYQVWGGLEPHQVVYSKGNLVCDCLNFTLGYYCKHLLAIRVFEQEPTVLEAVKSLRDPNVKGLNLVALWSEGGKHEKS